ncbi:MAG TPA: heavy metal translocating P-type ATPase [Candidatus Paceibacterota bacterium]|nr:heavy metal translocating P-type ATPase [Candidatus Paceibacterota bacterium]
MNHNHDQKSGGSFASIYYTCPMHPDVKLSAPGLCPDCGMRLVETEMKPKRAKNKSHPADDYDKHAGHRTTDFLKKFWVSLILTVPVVFYSNIAAEVLKIKMPAFPGSDYLPAIFGSFVFFYGGWIFLASGWREVKARLPGMMTLIAIAISSAYLWSVYAVFAGAETLFWELTTLITIMLLGHFLEMRAVQTSRRALSELSKLLPDKAEVIKDGKNELIPLSKLQVSDVVFVRPGGRIPADGIVIGGESDVDESLMTGESKPIKKREGSNVIAGALNTDGSLKIRVTKIGEQTFLSGVMRLVREAEASKSRLQVLSDRAAFYLTVIAVFGGLVTLIAWLSSGREVSFAVSRLVAVLVIACPHALGLAVPLVASISTTLAAKRGFLVRQRLALEAARNVDIVLFDKTGTLTRGSYGVTEIVAYNSTTADRLLQIAASVDAHSEHFISHAIVKEAKGKNIELLEVKNFQRVAGKGVRGALEGKTFWVGGDAILNESGMTVPPDLREQINKLKNQGKTIIYVTSDSDFYGFFALADVIRDESKEAINGLKKLGVKTAMVTGDTEEVAKWVADETGLEEYFARVLPGEKAGIVKKLQAEGKRVAMVGDGINDAPALTQSDLGIAIGAGTNVAIESAGIVLVRDDPRDITSIIKLSRATYSKMVQNLFWATGYNVIAIPLAAGALYSRGIILEPALAAVLMSASTVIVAFNALLLRRHAI